MTRACSHVRCPVIRMKHYRCQGITFFRFPENLDIRQKWIKAMGRGEGWHPDAYDFVDSTHFTDEDFDEKHNLKPQAIPTVFGRITNARTVLYYPVNQTLNKTKHFTIEIVDPSENATSTADDKKTLEKVNHAMDETFHPSEKRTKDKEALDKINHVTSEIVYPSENRTTSIADDKEALDKCHDYAATCPQFLKHKLEIANNKVAGLKRKLKSSMGVQSYYKRKAVSLKKDLKEKNKQIKELKTKLELCKDFPMHLFTKPSRSMTYSDEQMTFALTLYSHSRKAYDYLATLLNLPSTRTLRRRRAKKDVCPVSANDGSSVSANDGSSVLTNDVSSVSTNNGSSVSTNNGSSVSTNNGSSVSTNKGSSISTNNGSSVSTNKDSSVSTNKGSSVSTNKGSSVSTNNGSSVSTNNGSSVSTNNGSSVSTNKGSSVSTNKGSSVSTNKGSSISTKHGSSVSTNDGSPLLINDIFSLLTNDGSPVLTNVSPVLTIDGSPRLINYGSLVFTDDGSLLLNNDGTPVLSIDGLHF